MPEEKIYTTGFRWEKRKCVDCGKEFIAKQNKSVRCHDCRLTYNRKWQREWAEKKRAGEIKLKRPKKDDPNICDRIETCYYGGFAGPIHICDYLEITKTKRPCKPGEECVMYKKKGNEKKNRAAKFPFVTLDEDHPWRV